MKHTTLGRAAGLAVRSMTVRFGGVTALDDVSFEAQPGEILGILGPNGAGKTTLFNAISGVTRASRGAVTLADSALTGLSPERIAALGVVRTFQTPLMFWGLTVRESICVALAARERPGTFPPGPLALLLPSALGLPGPRRAAAARNERAAQLLEGTALAPLAQRRAESLAFGEERLLEVVRALALRPKVLLLDEPLSGLSAAEVREVLSEICKARAEGVIVLLVEHAVEELLSVSDRVVVLDYGKKIAEGLPADVRGSPLVVEAYLGDEVA